MNQRATVANLACAVALGLVACERTPASPASTTSAAVASAPSAPAPPPPPPPAPSFKGLVYPFMQQSCAQAPKCHGERPNHDVELDLRTADSAYAALVNVKAERRAGALRVKPGDPEASFLVAKLHGKVDRFEGKAMPLDPDTHAPPSSLPIDPAWMEKVLLPWIRGGAPKN